MAGQENPFNEYLDDLDGAMLDDYELYASECVEFWSSFDGNHGQLIIVQNHILPAAEQHAKNARPDWPYSDGPEDYYDAMYNSYDFDVIERAFSGAIEDSYGRLGEIWLNAEGLQVEHAFTAGPDNAGPHSTHAVWRG